MEISKNNTEKLEEKLNQVNTQLQDLMSKIAVSLHTVWVAEHSLKEAQKELEKIKSDYMSELIQRDSIIFELLEKDPNYFSASK